MDLNEWQQLKRVTASVAKQVEARSIQGFRNLNVFSAESRVRALKDRGGQIKE